MLPQSGLVPTLTLNHTLDDQDIYGNTFQFALSPEDEAGQVASRMASDGRHSAIALVPDSPWGDRVVAAFAERFDERRTSLP